MAEVTGQDLRDHGLTAKEIAVVLFARTMYSFGRDYFSIFSSFADGANGPNSEDAVGQATLKKLLTVEPITLDNQKFGGGQLNTDLNLKTLKFNDRIIRAERKSAIFGVSPTDNQGGNWVMRVDAGIRRATAQALGVSIDQNIVGAFTRLLPIIEIANKTTGTRRTAPKDTPTINKTNYVYRDGDWTTSDADQFNHESVHKIHGFFLDRKAMNCVLQLTPTARQLLAKTEQGQKMLDAGGIYGRPTSLMFVDTPHDLAAGNLSKNNSNTAYQYISGTDKLRLASRKFAKSHVDNDRVLFPSNQTMQATNLNALNDVAAGSFENIEVDPVDLVAAWDISSVVFGSFNRLNQHQEKEDIRFLGAKFIYSSFGIGSIVSDQNKVILIPIKGKKL